MENYAIQRFRLKMEFKVLIYLQVTNEHAADETLDVEACYNVVKLLEGVFEQGMRNETSSKED